MALFFLIGIIAQMSVLENWVSQSCAPSSSSSKQVRRHPSLQLHKCTLQRMGVIVMILGHNYFYHLPSEKMGTFVFCSLLSLAYARGCFFEGSYDQVSQLLSYSYRYGEYS